MFEDGMQRYCTYTVQNVLLCIVLVITLLTAYKVLIYKKTNLTLRNRWPQINYESIKYLIFNQNILKYLPR